MTAVLVLSLAAGAAFVGGVSWGREDAGSRLRASGCACPLLLGQDGAGDQIQRGA